MGCWGWLQTLRENEHPVALYWGDKWTSPWVQMQAAKFSSHLLGPKHSSPDWESAEKAQDMLHAFPTGGLARHREFSQELTLRLS